MQAPWVSALPLGLLQRLFLVGAVVASLLVARRLTSGTRWGDRIRRRFVLGVPWGTLLTALGVLLVYWVLQGGWADPKDPLVIPFRSWSYTYPVGVLVAGFGHNGVGHITGNLLATAAFAPVVEYAVSHYPHERGSQTFDSLATNPFVRILLVPAGSLFAGVFTGLFSLGPVIGFSGVVFAYIGFATVTRPLLTVVVIVGSSALDLLYRAFRFPYITRKAQPGFFSPWWADVAIQGHAIGILLGVVLGVLFLRRRGDHPDPLSLWVAALIVAVSENLWALYRPVGASEFGLFRAVGTALVFLFAAVVTAAVAASDRSLVPDFRADRFPSPGRVPGLEGLRGRLRPLLEGLPGRRRAAGLVVVVLLAGLSLSAVPFGFASVDGDLPEDATTVEVRDYTVTYVEGVPNQYVPGIDVSFEVFGREFAFDAREASNVRSSGVVVFSERRGIWIEAVSKGRLTFLGRTDVTVGGIGWREEVVASRQGWSLQGNGSSYKVYLRQEDEPRKLAFRTDRVTASPTIAGRNVSIRPTERGFDLVVTRGNRTLGRAPIPDPANETRVGGLTINRTGKTLFAIRNRTRVQVAQRQVPQARQN
ncbi:MAG: rhomboid family intramembrane serine protease [Haloarculaceae archaeon]